MLRNSTESASPSVRATISCPELPSSKARMGATHFLMKHLPNVAAEMALHVLANLTLLDPAGLRPGGVALRDSRPDDWPLRLGRSANGAVAASSESRRRRTARPQTLGFGKIAAEIGDESAENVGGSAWTAPS